MVMILEIRDFLTGREHPPVYKGHYWDIHRAIEALGEFYISEYCVISGE